MTDRLTDEQVRELWHRSEQSIRYIRGKECWAQAKAEIGLRDFDPIFPQQYESVRNRADELLKERGLDDAPLLYPDGPASWEEVHALLAEVRRARGME